MINLLPPEEKEKLFWEKKLRIAFILGFLSIVCLLVLWLSLLILKININIQKEVTKTAFQSETSKIEQINTIKREIAKINKTLKEINQISQERILLSEVFEKLTAWLPSDAYLDNFIFEKERQQIQITGKVKTLKSLNELKERLENQEMLKEIDFAIGSYIPGQEIEFRITFYLEK